jgi:sugar O-acyltransferase (sialic acid O-acetyltransferase NeuD family)
VTPDRTLVIAAAGGFGREVLAYARDAGFHVRGVLHDLDAYPGSLDDQPELQDLLLGRIEDHSPREDELVAVGLGDVAPRRAVTQALAARGARFATIVHPLAWVAPSARLGAGAVVAPFACIGPDARVGDHVVVNTYAQVGHDARAGDFSVLSPFSTLLGHARLGRGGFLGAHAVVSPRKTVGEDSSVAAGSVVTRAVGDRCLAAGNPAKARELYRRAPSDPGGPADHAG